MTDTTMMMDAAPSTSTQSHSASAELEKNEVVSTHVLVEQDKVDRLRDLSRRTRIAQSEYLREAVDDLLSKYEKENP
jgi:hypothetical protein